MRRTDKLSLPGDPGFYNDLYRGYRWNVVREIAGLEPIRKVKMEIHGFVLNDFRKNPPVSIWKNCSFELRPGFKPPLSDEPVPFQYMEEAMAHKRSMHLSMDEEDKVKVTALCPHPGIDTPAPDMIFLSKKDIKGR